jgi:hypothetical protein
MRDVPEVSKVYEPTVREFRKLIDSKTDTYRNNLTYYETWGNHWASELTGRIQEGEGLIIVSAPFDGPYRTFRLWKPGANEMYRPGLFLGFDYYDALVALNDKIRAHSWDNYENWWNRKNWLIIEVAHSIRSWYIFRDNQVPPSERETRREPTPENIHWKLARDGHRVTLKRVRDMFVQLGF